MPCYEDFKRYMQDILSPFSANTFGDTRLIFTRAKDFIVENDDSIHTIKFSGTIVLGDIHDKIVKKLKADLMAIHLNYGADITYEDT